MDCIIGFVTAWIFKGGLRRAHPLSQDFPAGPLLALHLWIAVSALVTVGRNLWQSASELTLRGLTYNVWITRGLSFRDDYFPLQELFFYSVALIALFAVWAEIKRRGERLLRGVAAAVLAGASLNALFAAWQKSTGKGWFAGAPTDVNAFWADIHSFASLMTIAIAIGLGLILTRQLSPLRRMTVVAAIAVATIGLYLSGSRSTLLILFLLLCLAALWAAFFASRGWQRAIPIALVVSLSVALTWVFLHGYRGVSLSTIGSAIETFSFASLNAAVSHRPEIWRATISMYSSFPLFGLGQGALQRLSSISQFSGSDVLVNMGGAGAHNYFLQSFVELGLVGFGIVTLIAIPVLRLGRDNFRLLSFYGLTGVAMGNLYGHSLLVREMLMLTAIFAGAYLWEARTLATSSWREPGTSTLRYTSIVLLGLALAACAEVAASFARSPFTYGEQCFEKNALEPDGWTKSILRVAVPSEATRVIMTIAPGAQDNLRRSLDVELALLDEKDALLHQAELRFERGDAEPRRVDLPLGAAVDRKRFLEVRPSHCFVPLNLGYALDSKHDTRRLGARITNLRFAHSGSE